MEISPYLIFNGNCKEAFTYYATLLNGQLTLMTHGESPMGEQAIPEAQDLVMHGQIDFDGKSLMGADAFPPGSAVQPQGFSVMVGCPTVEEAERVFAALSEGGNVTMQMEKTFWAERFGEVIDRWGTPWMINCSKPMG